jgi:hypothetical protein
MEQRRRKSELKVEDPRPDVAAPALSATKKKELSKVSMGQDLQAIMARRRKMAGDASSEEDELPPVMPQTTVVPDDDMQKALEKPSTLAKLSMHLDQIGEPGRRKQASDGESTISGSIVSKSGERRSRRKSRLSGDEPDEPSERRKMRTRRSKSGDSLSDDVSVDQSVSSRRRRSSDDDTIASGLSSSRKGRRSDEKNLPPSSSRASRQGPGLGASSVGAGVLTSLPEPSEKKELHRRKLSSQSSSSGEEKPVMKSTKGRPKPTPGQSVADSHQSRKNAKSGNSSSTPGIVTDTAVSGWGDFPAFGGADGFESSDALNNDDGFGSFGNFTLSANNTDTASAAFDFAPPSTRGESKRNQRKIVSKNDFDAPFSASAFENFSTFEAFDSKSPAFNVTFPAMEGSGFSTLPFAEESVPQKVWDKSPLTGELPVRTVQRPLLSQDATMCTGLCVPPVSNPSNGNCICCIENNGTFEIIEIDPSRGNLHVLSISMMSREFRNKVADKYNILVHKVETVLALSVGLQRSKGQIRTNVVAILDLLSLESNQVLRVVAVWQWGGGTGHPAIVQHTISPPSSGEFSFEPSSLRNTDGLLFIAGASPKGPCIFICNPSNKEAWSANFLGGAGSISCMAVSSNLHRMYPYLVVAMKDGTISIWNYGAALLPPGSKEAVATTKRWLTPACRLEASACFTTARSNIQYKESHGECPHVYALISHEKVANLLIHSRSGGVGFCTQLAFCTLEHSRSSLPLLAAAFQNGLAVFHVGLPVRDDTGTDFKSYEMTTSAPLAQVPAIGPIVAKTWEGRRHEKASVAWLHAGPHHGPCLVVSLGGDHSASQVIIGSINFQLYDRRSVKDLANEALVPFQIVTVFDVDDDLDKKPLGFLPSYNLGSLVSYSRESAFRFTLRDPSVPRSKAKGVVSALSRPVASLPCGLTSAGEVLLVDENDGPLHIFSLLHCEQSNATCEDHLLRWSKPMMQHLLCRASVGDTKQQHLNLETLATEKMSEEVHGGAECKVVCELFHEKLRGYVPMRVFGHRCEPFCAIAYRATLGTSTPETIDVSWDASLFAFVDWSSGGANVAIEVLQARDITFLPSGGVGGVRGLILSSNGSRLTYFEWDMQKKCCELKSAYRPIVGVDVVGPKDLLECRRIFAFEGAGKVILAASASRIRDSRSCIVIGELSDAESVNEKNWSAILPNIEVDRSCFLEKHEEINDMIGLEGDGSGYRNFAVSTCDRVLLLTSGLTIAAQADLTDPCSGLSPLGAFATGFMMGNKACYLCCLDGHLASGSICTFPLSKRQHSLISIRPDRIVFFDGQSRFHTAESGENAQEVKLYVAKTIPALLLEPMIANAVCVGDKQNVSTPVLRTVIEKFGRKLASITHGENEGIGTFGAGISARVFEILGRYGLSHASTWLLTGTVQFQRNSNSRVLSPWLSVAQKMKGGFSSDTLLHLISNGDQYYSDYLKSPDHNMTSTLPRQSDPSMYVCRAYAETAMEEGKLVDALKMFDMCGTQYTENVLVQLAAIREREGPNSVLRALKGHSDASLYTSNVYASLAVHLSEQQTRQTQMNTDGEKRLAKQLAPSLQGGMRVGRARHKVMGESSLDEFGRSKSQDTEPLWATSCNEAKHIWYVELFRFFY